MIGLSDEHAPRSLWAGSLRSEVCCPRVTCFLLLAFCFFMILVFHVMDLVSSSSYLQSCLKAPFVV